MSYYFEDHSIYKENKSPSEFLTEMNDEFTSLLTETANIVGKLDGICRFAPNLDLYINLLMVQEACASCELENIPARFYDFYCGEGISKNLLMPSNLLRAIKYVQNHPFSESIIKKAHGTLTTSEIKESKYRGTQHLSIEHIFMRHLTHPIPSSWIPTPINDMEKYILNDNSKNGLIKAATIQYQLEVLSPFDHHSRMIARMMAMFTLKWSGLLKYPVLWISNYLSDVKIEYKDRIAATYKQDEGMLWIMWIKFFLLAVNESAKNTMQLIESLTDAREKHMTMLTQISNENKSAQIIYEYISRNVIVNVRQISDALGLSFSGVTRLKTILAPP
jgi:Fic family protein